LASIQAQHGGSRRGKGIGLEHEHEYEHEYEFLFSGPSRSREKRRLHGFAVHSALQTFRIVFFRANSL
jgi:hypothetical protein